MSAQRPAWIEIDLSALRHNASLIRREAGHSVTVYAVVKGDAYGVGIPAAVEALKDTQIDAFAAGDFDEAIEVRRCSPDATILLYGSYTPDQIAELATFGIVLTVYSPECLAALAYVDRPLTILVKVDCGFGRLGFRENEMEAVLRSIQGLPHIELRGLYTHIGAVEDPTAVSIQADRFAVAQRCARRLGFSGLEYMMASSRILLGYPQLRSNAVNPGRSLYGLLESPWSDRIALRPVFRAVKSRLLQIKRLQEGRRHGYGQFVEGLPSNVRVGIAAIGFAAGLPRSMSGTQILVGGRRAKVIGLAAMEHLLLDLTGIDGAAVGDEVVLIGQQGNDAITGEAFSQQLGMTELELLPRLGRGLRRCYV
ncbi:MAG: alanine racemase [Acidobacteria bacterium]|nr:alanine racemase [Acidobacteriota bacterium]